MEAALWNLEDKWKLSTQRAIALFAATTSLLFIVICIVVVVVLKMKKSNQEACKPVVVEVLMGSVRWSGPRRNVPSPLVTVKRDDDRGWSHNSSSAVWQRPILMGEKCELPRFSGLILYDQRGIPLHHHHQYCAVDHYLENMAGVERTTLRDLL